MARGKIKNFERQMLAIQNLEIPPRIGATITKFETEEWTTGHVFVKREYCPGSHAPTLLYTEGFVVGVLGGVKQLYSHGNY